MLDIFSIRNTTLYSFNEIRKTTNNPFQELTKKFPRDRVLARLRREKVKGQLLKTTTSYAVCAQLFQQQAFSQWGGLNKFVVIDIISFHQTQIHDFKK